ncbi:hypothetical protein [Yoonia sp.]|uniref:hypothetical protein n=1 Tax=Yoonia sp. TaxID=2212373 RepID=UPI001A001BD5|nr:hypothetical protein [Yoonia sp.]MBE0413012.1 hypothetical protein [Yoonia sp.]
MAIVTTPTTTTALTGILSAFATRLIGWCDRVMAAQCRTDIVTRLQNSSDADLARLGITRSDIVRDVYRDRFYI